MMRGPLSPRVHGFLDYGAIALLLLAPMIFGFGGTPAMILRVLAVAYLAMVLLTAYPLGVLKVIPFTVHGYVEAVVSIFLIAAPFVFGFSQMDDARNFFLVAGIALVGVFLLTNYKAAEAPGQGVGARRRVTV